MKNSYRHIISTMMLCICISVLPAQDCKQAFVSGFSNYTTSSVLIKWIDFSNDSPLGYEIELGLKGFSRTGIATTNLIAETEYNYTGLESGTTYEFWLRTVCDNSSRSIWNGPFNFKTNMTNPSTCMVKLEIDNDNCPSTNKFRIDINSYPGAKLGIDYILDKIDLIIEHPWPPDLAISLRSPGGKLVDLSIHHGIGSKNYGSIENVLCQLPASFTADACEKIEEVSPPYIGSFRPEGDLNDFLDGSNVNGTWTIEICDRADGDIGFLRYAKLNFLQESCPLPFITIVNDIEGSNVTLRWDQPINCDDLQLEIGPVGFLPGTEPTIFINCNLEKFVISDLSPNTQYEYYIRSVCGPNSSSYSCPFVFKTGCADVSLSSSFDDQEICPSNCNKPCEIHGIWNNTSDDDHDWIVQKDATPTNFTGPQNDFYNFGNSLYIENLTEICSPSSEAILQSACLKIQANEEDCSMIFGYHMYGVDINKLTLEISLDDGESWSALWSVKGDQENKWKTATVDLENYDNRLALMRFKAMSGKNVYGDIGLDQIDFFGTLINEEISYYFDEDQDGYGNPLSTIQRCSDIPPTSYVANNLDCDDSSPLIHPMATEIPCNLIDENCNGSMDDALETNPIQYTVNMLTNESCRGAQDAAISLDITGGLGPYQVRWNDGQIGNPLMNISEGIYYGEIKDVNGCLSAIDFIEVDANFGLNVFLQNKTNTTCEGINNGSLSVAASGGVQPYSFQWDNGMTGAIIDQLSPGKYGVVVEDMMGCKSDTIYYEITAKPKLIAGVQNLNNVRCFGGSSGSILLGANNGTAPYKFVWSTEDSTAQLSNLTAGFYSCTISDQNNCINIVKNIEIKQPIKAQILIDNIQQISCADEQDGSIEISTLGGNPPFTFKWNTGKLTDDIFGLKPNYYSVTATDSRGCAVIRDSIHIESPPHIEIFVDSIGHVDCPLSSDGFIDVHVTGGSGNYYYFWSVEESPDTSILTGITPAKYNLTIIDQFNCKSSKNQIEVTALNEAIDINLDLESSNICRGDSIASIIAMADSGHLPISYNWSAGEQNISNLYVDTLVMLPSGTYNVTATDNEGCIGVSPSLLIPVVNNFNYTIEQLTHNLCFGDSMGSILLNIEGGVPPFDIMWNNGAVQLLNESLASGNYKAFISDDRLCQLETQIIKILSPTAIQTTVDKKNQTIGNTDGYIKLTVNGGVPEYQISWQDHPEWNGLFNISNLTAGEYIYHITDKNLCSFEGKVMVDLINATNNINSEKLINIYPNPTTDWFEIKINIQLSKNNMVELLVYDIHGKAFPLTTLKTDISPNETIIRATTSGLTSGVYTIMLKTGKQDHICRLVVVE